MKTTFKYIFAIVSLFAFSSAAFAQGGAGEDPEQKYEGVHAEKSATYDFTTQKGEITLESFVEGFIKPAEQKPLDIVFVWDESGCMNGNIGEQKAQMALGNIVRSFVSQVQEKVPDSRLGLVTFSNSASLVCKLTNNATIFGDFLPTGSSGNRGGHLNAIASAINELNTDGRSDGLETQKILVFLTGGHNSLNSDLVSDVASFKKAGGLVVSILIEGRGATTAEEGYMEHASSNYPNANSYDNFGTKGDPAIYYLYTQDPSDFSAFFEALAESITSVPDMGPTVMTKDVLSPSFKLPAGTELSDINAYAVPCTGFVFDETSGEVKEYNFETDKTKWQSLSIEKFVEGQTYPEETDITKVKVYGKLTTSEDGNDQLELTGFDYKTFFCGPVYSDSGSKTDPKGKKYDVVGYKFVITLPIVLASGNAASLTTNTKESGLYAQNGDQIAFFPLPEVYFAYLTIVKKGLAKGESALFKVSKTISGVTSEVCQVALTGDGNESVSKGIYAGMFKDGDSYTVEELTDWGWTYKLDGMTLFVGDIEVTGDNKIFEMIADDPDTEEVEGNEGRSAVFTFTNTKQTVTVKNAEHGKLNVLEPGKPALSVGGTWFGPTTEL